MFLHAPKPGVKPTSSRSQKGAFTGKAATKIKKWKPPEEEGDVAKESKAQKVESEFVTWMRKQTTTGAWHIESAKDYVLEGPPWKGDSTFDAKQDIKDRDGRWCPNLAKAKDCDDKTIRRGWWSAWDSRVLLLLLGMPPDDRGRRPWACCALVETQQIQVIHWLKAFHEAQGISVHTSCPIELTSVELPLTAEGVKANDKANWKGVPQWIIDANAKYVSTWVQDTVCVVCKRSVDDQFMDCSCQEAVWQRCNKCSEKFRTDFAKGLAMNSNAWCKC